jgi:outer membrane protein assembly factor BamB
MSGVAICIALCGLFAMTADAADILGARPGYAQGAVSSVANDQAITRMIWAPGLEDGYDPQGLAWADGAVYLSAYRSANPNVGTGPCRIFKIDPEDGRTLAQFDLPADCGHAGGLAYAGHGTLIAADTRRLFRINMAAAFNRESRAGAVTATVALNGELKGSFADFDGVSIFIGTYTADPARAKGFFLPLSVFDTHNGGTVDETAAIRSIPLPTKAQGAAFDQAGNLWISASSSRFGTLYRLDSKTGKIAASFDAPAGIEDLAFDDQGRLWSVSEAGALRFRYWATTFPLLFRIDVGRLKGSR